MTQTSSSQPEKRAEKLLQKFFDGDLTVIESEELLAYWDQNPQFDTFARKNLEVEQYLRFFAAIEKNPIAYNQGDESESVCLTTLGTPFQKTFAFEPLDLNDLVRLEAESQFIPSHLITAQSVTAEEVEEETASVLATLPSSVKKNYYFRKDPMASRLGQIAITLCIIIAAVAIYYEFNPAPPSSSNSPKTSALMAKVTALDDPVFPDHGKSFKTGQRISRETISLVSGMMEIRLENDVRIVLEGSATLDLRSAMKTFCREGRLSVEVPKNASGFEIQTPLMNVRDIGTEFVIDASNERCAVHVIKGEVEIDRFVNAWTPLTEGLGMVAKPGNVLLQMLADTSLFITESQAEQRAMMYESRRLEAWKTRKDKLASDSDLLLYLDFMQENPAVVEKNSRSVRGRWSTKSAVAFPEKSDVVQLSVPQRRKSFTLIASVWMYAFTRHSNTIFSIGETSRGALSWQLTQSGEMQLLLGDQPQAILTNHSSPPKLSYRDTGIWFYLATVVDAENRTVTHYIDGKPIASDSWSGDTSFDFNHSQLGNWLRQDHSPSARNFNGKIDEFILIGRAATPEEIHDLSQ